MHLLEQFGRPGEFVAVYIRFTVGPGPAVGGQGVVLRLVEVAEGRVGTIVPVTLQRKLRFLCCFGEVAGVWFWALDAGELCDATGESAGDFCGR